LQQVICIEGKSMTVSWVKHKSSAGDPGATAKPIPRADEEEGVGSATFAGSSVPHWKDPILIKNYLVSDDPIEHDLVSYLLDVDHEIREHLGRSWHSDTVEEAATWFGDAQVWLREYVSAATNLDRYRRGGVQSLKVVRTSDIAIGVNAKVETFRKFAPGSPEAHLVEEINDIARIFEEAARRFNVEASTTEAHIGDDEYRRRQERYRLPVPTHKGAAAWRRLAQRASADRGKVLNLVTKLAIGKRQVMVIEARNIEPSDPGSSQLAAVAAAA
jgi:hypothetical protein